MPAINFNWASVTAQRNMASNQVAFHTAVQRLSSGLRINSAADDAAGLFISEKLQNQVKGLNQASRNAQDGISMIQTAEGALNVTHSILERMRELAVQSANGVLTSADRQAISDEVKTLTDEISRVSATTNFNTMKLLDGSMGGSFAISGTQNYQGVQYTGATALTGANLDSNHGIVSILAESSSTTPRYFQVTATAATTGANPTSTVTMQELDSTGTALGAAVNQTVAVPTSGMKLVSFQIPGGTTTTGIVQPAMQVDVTVNQHIGDDDGNPATTPAAANAIDPANNADGFTVVKNVSGILGAGGNAAIPAAPGAATSGGTIINMTGVTLQVGANDLASDRMVMTDVNSMSAESLGLKSIDLTGVTQSSGLFTSNTDPNFPGGTSLAVAFPGTQTGYSISDNVKTQTGAQQAIDIIDNAVAQVSNLRGKLGAFQNRLEYTIKNLGVASENQAAANSAIRDADVAQEVSNMVRTQILAQAGTAVLAQANQAPQMLLSLLR